MVRTKRIGYSLAGGIVLTLFTSPIPLMTSPVTSLGFPMEWFIYGIVGGPRTWDVYWLGLGVDVIVWTAIVLVILVLYDRFSS